MQLHKCFVSSLAESDYLPGSFSILDPCFAKPCSHGGRTSHDTGLQNEVQLHSLTFSSTATPNRPYAVLQGALPYFGILCEAFVSWRQIRDPGLLNEMGAIMQMYKQSLSSSGHWEAAQASLAAPVLDKLLQTYGL